MLLSNDRFFVLNLSQTLPLYLLDGTHIKTHAMGANPNLRNTNKEEIKSFLPYTRFSQVLLSKRSQTFTTEASDSFKLSKKFTTEASDGSKLYMIHHVELV